MPLVMLIAKVPFGANSPFPAVDPMGTLPTVCDPTLKSNPYCAGTLMFVLRRIPAK